MKFYEDYVRNENIPTEIFHLIRIEVKAILNARSEKPKNKFIQIPPPLL